MEKKKLLKKSHCVFFPFTNDFLGTLCECQSHYAHFYGCGVLNLPVIPGPAFVSLQYSMKHFWASNVVQRPFVQTNLLKTVSNTVAFC